MAQIIASTKEISNKKQALVTLSNSLKTQLTDLETLGSSLNSMWEGAAKEKYSKQLKADIVKMQSLLRTILEFILILKSVYLIATRDLSNLWLQFFLSQNQGFMRLFEKTVLK